MQKFKQSSTKVNFLEAFSRPTNYLKRQIIFFWKIPSKNIHIYYSNAIISFLFMNKNIVMNISSFKSKKSSVRRMHVFNALYHVTSRLSDPAKNPKP